MDLGLEHLGARQLAGVSSDELLDTTVTLFTQLDNMVDTTRYIDLINDRIVMMEELQNAVNKHGYTESMETLFGSNFEYGYSHEGLGEQISNAWKTFVEWCKKIWQRIKDVFALFFNSADKMISKLEERKKAIEQHGLKNENTKVTIPGATMIKQIAQVLSKDLNGDLQKAAKEVEEIKAEAAKGIPDDAIPKHLAALKPILERYAQLGVDNIAAGVDVIKNAGDNDDVTLTKNIAISMIGTTLEVLKALKAAKKYVDDLHKNINELLNTKGKAVARMNAGKEAGDQMVGIGNAILNSPTGRELIGRISKWCAGLISKGTKAAIVMGSRLLSITAPASA